VSSQTNSEPSAGPNAERSAGPHVEPGAKPSADPNVQGGDSQPIEVANPTLAWGKMHPFVALMKRYVVEYLQCQNASVCAHIMEPDYMLYMGGSELGPRDEVYVPAVVRQLEQFPGLGMTVNEIILNGDRLAMRFSQHGSSVRHDGRQAAWSGIGLYRWNGSKLTSNFAIEDYYSRKQQLGSGLSLSVESPAVAPWDTRVEPSNPEAEASIRSWLASGMAFADHSVVADDEGSRPSPLISVEQTVIDDLFSAGNRVAFACTQTGTYVGGLKKGLVGEPCTLYSVGVVEVDVAGMVSGRVVRERAGLERQVVRP
jgi:predicted ester cyclase